MNTDSRRGGRRGRGAGKREKPRYSEAQAVVIRRHGTLLSLQNGEEYYYANETSVEEERELAPSKVSRETRGLSISMTGFDSGPPTVSRNLGQNELSIDDTVNWRRLPQSPCPDRYWIKAQEKKEETPPEPMFDEMNVNLRSGFEVCPYSNLATSVGQRKEEAHDSQDEQVEENFMEAEDSQKQTRIKVCTWNINHLSNDNALKREKLQALWGLLDQEKPDVLVLHEINLFNEISDGETWEVNDLRYKWHFGPMLRTVGNVNVTKTGSQYEYYAMLCSESVGVVDEYAIEVHSSCDRNIRKYNNERVGPASSPTKQITAQTVHWVEHRPLVVRELVHRETGAVFAVGIVHTSPSFDVRKTAFEYVRAMDARYANPEVNIPWMLAGDWYVKTNYKVNSGEIRQGWSDILTAWDARLWNTDEDTNFPDKGHGMPADYFVTDSNWSSERGAMALACGHMRMGQVVIIGWGTAVIKTGTGEFMANPHQFMSVEECGQLLESNHGTLKAGDIVYFYEDQEKNRGYITAGKFVAKGWKLVGLSDHAPVSATFDLYYYA